MSNAEPARPNMFELDIAQCTNACVQKDLDRALDIYHSIPGHVNRTPRDHQSAAVGDGFRAQERMREIIDVFFPEK